MRTGKAGRVAGGVVVAMLCAGALIGWGDSTIGSNRYAWGGNVGWIDWAADGTNGAVIGDYVCSNFLYGANIGWINLGGGAPTNGIRYTNASADDFGVNHDGMGALRGYAWGANVGWLAFEDTGNPRVDLMTGDLSGCVWGANIGWIALSTAVARVATDRIDPGPDTDGDGIADAWERERAGDLGTLGLGNDEDGDGVDDTDEYPADTDPLSRESSLRVTEVWSEAGGMAGMAWDTRATRIYEVESVDSPTNRPGWARRAGPALGSGGPMEVEVPELPGTQQFYRVRAYRPLSGP